MTITRNKYGAKKTEYNGRIYDSKAEAAYAKHLDFLKHAHNSKDRVVTIEYQPCFPIHIKKHHVFDYFADFRVGYADAHEEIIDVKGMKTDVYKLKKKCVEALYDIRIIEA